MKKIILMFMTLGCLASVLSACGQTGRLYLPEENEVLINPHAPRAAQAQDIG